MLREMAEKVKGSERRLNSVRMGKAPCKSGVCFSQMNFAVIVISFVSIKKFA